jgi:hypothetical protein
MKKLQDWAALVFIACVALLAVISVLGIWKLLNDDVIGKSMETIGLLGAVAIIIIVAGKFVGRGQAEGQASEVVNPVFTGIRTGTVSLLIVSVSLLALFGVLSIWEVLSKDVLHKSLASLAVVAFDAVVIMVACMTRENHQFFHGGEKFSIGRVLGVLLLVLFGVPFIWLFLGGLFGGF